MGSVCYGLKSVAESVDVVVDHAGNAEQDYASRTDGEGGTRSAVALEVGDGLLVGVDVHGLDNEQVVVQRDHGVDQCQEHEQVESSVEGCHEDEELREEACKRGNTSEGEEAEGHEEGQLGIGLVEPVVVVHTDFSAVLLNNMEHGESAEVGCHVDEEIEDEGGHALRSAAHDAEHEVACLRDGGEGHEALEIFLANGKEVGNRDGSKDDPEEAHAPHALEGFGAEELHEDGHEHEGG